MIVFGFWHGIATHRIEREKTTCDLMNAIEETIHWRIVHHNRCTMEMDRMMEMLSRQLYADAFASSDLASDAAQNVNQMLIQWKHSVTLFRGALRLAIRHYCGLSGTNE